MISYSWNSPAMTSIHNPATHIKEATLPNIQAFFTLLTESFSLCGMTFQATLPAPDAVKIPFKVLILDIDYGYASIYYIWTGVFCLVVAWSVLCALVIERREYVAKMDRALLILSGPCYMPIISQLFSVLDCTLCKAIVNPNPNPNPNSNPNPNRYARLHLGHPQCHARDISFWTAPFSTPLTATHASTYRIGTSPAATCSVMPATTAL